MRIAITGGSGFLGSRMAEHLTQLGHQVRVIDINEPRADSVEWLQCDVLDTPALTASLAGCDVIYHAAAIADLTEARSNPRRAVDVNICGTLSALEAASDANLERFLLVSSVYALSAQGAVYRTTKRAAEGLVEDLSGPLNLSSTILRFGSLYGPGADSDNAVYRIVRQALTTGRIEFWGDGTEVREYVHVDDAARMAVKALAEHFVGEAVHIAGQDRIETRQIVEMVNEILGGGIRITFNDVPYEGRYRITPYTYSSPRGLRMTSDSYVDLGVGLLHVIDHVAADL